MTHPTETPPIDHTLCLGPRPDVAPASFDIPSGACDTHAHVIGDGVRYPYVENRSYTPPPAPEEKYLAMLAACGMSRGVLVQVSVHGTDNRYMLDVLGRHPPGLHHRGQPPGRHRPRAGRHACRRRARRAL